MSEFKTALFKVSISIIFVSCSSATQPEMLNINQINAGVPIVEGAVPAKIELPLVALYTVKSKSISNDEQNKLKEILLQRIKNTARLNLESSQDLGPNWPSYNSVNNQPKLPSKIVAPNSKGADSKTMILSFLDSDNNQQIGVSKSSVAINLSLYSAAQELLDSELIIVNKNTANSSFIKMINIFNNRNFPAQGILLETRDDKSNAIINIGRSHGISKGQKIAIYDAEDSNKLLQIAKVLLVLEDSSVLELEDRNIRYVRSGNIVATAMVN